MQHFNSNSHSRQVFSLLAFGGMAVFPMLGGSYGIDLVSKIMLLAIFALSLELLVGAVGLVCFGQAAFFGIGAYCAVLFSPPSTPASLLWLMPLSMLMAALYALAVGALALRTRGVYFIMVTLAFAQMAYYVVHDTPLGGGTDGIYLLAKPVIGTWFNPEQPLALYGLILACLAFSFCFLGLLGRSAFGRALAGIRVNEQRMRAAGFSTYPYKLAAFVISGGLAGLAGFLFAVKDGFVNPELISWHLSGEVLIMVILGGQGHLRGAVLGAFAFVLLQEFFKSEAIFGEFAKHWHLGVGLTIIASVALLPKGLVGIPTQIATRLRGRLTGTAGAHAESAANER